MIEQNTRLGIGLMIATTFVFAVQDGISRLLATDYNVMMVVMIRYWFFAAFVIALSARAPGGVRAASRTAMPLVQIARGVLLVAQILVIVTSFDLVGLSGTHAIFALHPLLATLLAIPLLGEVVGWRRLMAVAVGFAGVIVILRPGAEVIEPAALVPLLAAGMFAVYSVLTRMASRADGNSRAAFFYTGVAGAVAITLVGPFHWTAMTWPDMGWLALLCLTGMSGHYCLIRALDATEAVRIQPFIYLQMVLGMAIGWTVFGEAIEATALIGVAMIVGAGLYAIWREARALRRARA